MITHQNDYALLVTAQKSSSAAAAVTRFFADQGVSITSMVLYQDADLDLFRVAWSGSPEWAEESDFVDAFYPVADELKLSYSLRGLRRAPNVGLICSGQTHVLQEALNAMTAPDFPAFNVPFVISDGEAARKVADRAGVPFFFVASLSNVDELIRQQTEIIKRYQPDFLGLARYDALLSQSVIDQAGCPILTVHNSFLPKVISEKAYKLAHEQGVKSVGATSRLVQSRALGPIVTQKDAALKAGDNVSQVRNVGHQIEHKVFVQALRKLVEHKVMVYNAKTIVFD